MKIRLPGNRGYGFGMGSILAGSTVALALLPAGCGGSSETETSTPATTPSTTTTTAGVTSTSGGGRPQKVVVNTPGTTTTTTTTSTGGGTSGGGSALEIAVIPKGTTHEYWKAIHAGAMKAAQDLQAKGQAVDIKWQGPLQENDRNGQVNIVETFVQQKVSGIVLAPLDSHALVRPVEDAEAAGIPVVIIDSDLDSNKYVSFVATDNKKGGVMAGQELARLLGGKGRVLMMRYQEGSASTEAREAGFLEAMKANPGITIVSDDQYGGPSVEKAYQTGQNLLTRYGKQVDGIFTPNESTARGMRLALKDANLLGKVRFVGFDSSKDLIDALRAKEIQALVLQNPFKMGDEGVTTLVDAIQKKTVPKRIDTGVALVTPENMDTPEMKALLNPPLEEYLK